LFSLCYIYGAGSGQRFNWKLFTIQGSVETIPAMEEGSSRRMMKGVNSHIYIVRNFVNITMYF
jgi:hypothetical protein